MSFTEQQVAALSADLSKSAVRTRKQAGRDLSYIEGWHAIAEANRIFGFDAWDRETVDIRQLGEPREVDGKWRVGYMARVRFTVRTPGGMTVVREGCGFGSGIDRDVGQAHESALKESETDAAKRAMSTFGNPFGLALYDKTQAHVSDAPPPAEKPVQEKPAAPVKPYAIKVPATPNGSDWPSWGKQYAEHMRAIRNVDEGYAWIDMNADALANCGRDAPKIADRIKVITKETMDALESQAPDNGKAAA
jgi:DNA repair and recombination protein RAD52